MKIWDVLYVCTWVREYDMGGEESSQIGMADSMVETKKQG